MMCDCVSAKEIPFIYSECKGEVEGVAMHLLLFGAVAQGWRNSAPIRPWYLDTSLHKELLSRCMVVVIQAFL